MHAPQIVQNAIARFEGEGKLDATAARLGGAAAVIVGPARRAALRGEWLGHALHPLLTDLPLGCWISSGLLDIAGGKTARKASQRLVGLGLFFVPPTVASGLAEYEGLDRAATRRVGVVHAAGNTVVASLYFLSWRARRRGRQAPGVVYGLTGGALAWGTGYLGGHLSFARSVGTGPRGLDDTSGEDADTGAQRVMDLTSHEAADDQDAFLDVHAASVLLSVPPQQVEAMVEEGMLVAVSGPHPLRFREADVRAVRLLGG